MGLRAAGPERTLPDVLNLGCGCSSLGSIPVCAPPNSATTTRAAATVSGGSRPGPSLPPAALADGRPLGLAVGTRFDESLVSPYAVGCRVVSCRAARRCSPAAQLSPRAQARGRSLHGEGPLSRRRLPEARPLGLARFDKLARNYLSFLHFASALIWLR